MKYSLLFLLFFPVLCFSRVVVSSDGGLKTDGKSGVCCADTLQVNVAVDYPSKCGRPTGEVTFTVTGGSGQYAYSLGGPHVGGLPPGPGMGIVIDNVTGAVDTGFFNIPAVQAEGDVNINVFQPLCAGGAGNIAVTVTPGLYFKAPYTFSITNTTGLPFPDPGNLAPGSYYLFVADADSCVLPPKLFFIINPMPLIVNANITNGTCATTGQIDLQITGGTGGYYIDWTDINGVEDAPLRKHLAAGRYQVAVFDSLFCKDTLSNILVKNSCSKRDTFHLLVPLGSSNSYCFPPSPGFVSAETAFQLLSGNSSANGSWVLSDNCLKYNSLTGTGLDLDKIIIAATTPGLMQNDTFVVLVSVVNSITSETVYFTSQVNTSTAACGTIPAPILQKKVIPLNVPGLSGTSSFGQFSLNAASGCLAYSSYETPRFFADSIAAAVCDINALKCHVISYVPSILPFADCSKKIIQPDSLVVSAVECAVPTNICLGIPYADILNFNILDNNILYNTGATGCGEAPVTAYMIADLPFMLQQSAGPFYLNNWVINGATYSGVFGNLNELLVLLNQIDPLPGWYADQQSRIIGGQQGNVYGPLRVTAANEEKSQALPQVQSAPLGSQLHFNTGTHFIILKKIQTGCADTLVLHVQCDNCPPVQTYTADPSTILIWNLPVCNTDTLFLTTIPASEIPNWSIADNGTGLTNFETVGNLAGFRLQQGFHQIQFDNAETICTSDLKVQVNCDSTNIVDKVLIYNGLSPNGDGKNDVWYIDGISDFGGNEVWVYNHWGNEVFHQKGYDNQWAGDWNNHLLPDGVYYYVVDLGNGSKRKKGALTISR